MKEPRHRRRLTVAASPPPPHRHRRTATAAPSALAVLVGALATSLSSAELARRVRVTVGTSEACENQVEVRPTSKLAISWSGDHLGHSHADPLGCIDVTGLRRFQVRVKGLPAKLAIRVRAQSRNAGTATINGNVVTFTLPAKSTITDNRTIEVHDASSDGQQGSNVDSAWVKVAYV